jgi:endo-1,4-beta-xylanase
MQSSRRNFLRTAGAGALGMSLAARLFASPREKGKQTSLQLGALAAQKEIAFGFALNPRLLANPAYADLVAHQCSIVTPENAMKWESIHPAPDKYTFAQADAVVAFAGQHALKVRGHCFCWHRALPLWLTQQLTRQNAEAVLRAHIAMVAGRYKGKLHSWDVVNEAIHLPDNQPNGWRNSFWYRLLGPAYVDIAYQAARHADPAAILTYNEWGLEYENRSDSFKRKAVLAMLRDLKKRGIPVGALGLQSHLRAGTGEKFSYDLPHFIAEVHALGLQVYVTEMDVDDSHLTVQGDERDQAVANVYKNYLDLVLGTASVPVVITWGAWDIPRVTGAEAISGLSAQRPLLFDASGNPKLAAASVARCFAHAPKQDSLQEARK